MLLGISGLLQSGKDTCFSIIRELYPHAERLAFADKLKVSAAAALGCSVEIVERLKVDEDIVFVPIRRGRLIAAAEECVPEFTMRQYLQRYGTEAHRDVFGASFWIDQALPRDFDHSRRIVCFCDCRFENEANRIHDLGGCVVEIVRPNCRPRLAASNGHASESGIGELVDYRIVNDGTLDDLREKVAGLMECLADRNDRGCTMWKCPGAEAQCF